MNTPEQLNAQPTTKTNETRDWAPPPLPAGQRPSVVLRAEQDAFEAEFKPMEAITVSTVLDALLKHPAQITHEVLERASGRVRPILMGLVVLFLLAYGVVMGCFSGGHQLWAVPVKVLSGVFISAVICLPSLYILSAMSGSRVSLDKAWGLLLMALALASLLLVGFAPVAWLFSQSTKSDAWMGLLHLLLWVASLGFGCRLLRRGLGMLGGRTSGVLNLWVVVFLAVLFQMSTVLRPMIGPYAPPQFGQKLFFVQHWGDCMSK